MPRDEEICWQIREAMARDLDLDVYSINIDCVNGLVRLDGLVENAEARHRAEQIASVVEGVRFVDNSLTVPMDKDISDRELENASREAISQEAGLDLKDVEVEVVEGNVILRGEVQSIGDVRTAEEVVERIKGARDAISELDVRDIGYDDQINLTVEQNIISDRELSRLNVTAYTEGGIVFLNGAVNTIEQRERAERLAAQVEGVREVRNRLEVLD
ncbi:MAG: BON domain-containing protein [bacterium]|nr:BON domain-containing protein [bacterium]MDD4153012.1 BON domain-containing protein [bacterium]MDD4558266.1 BON domain-containing protein [bacterium]